MIHDETIDEHLAEKVGIERLATFRVDVPGNRGANFYRLRKEEPKIKKHKMGLKQAFYNNETSTWELRPNREKEK